MSKKCATCGKNYSDQLEHCPHCATAEHGTVPGSSPDIRMGDSSSEFELIQEPTPGEPASDVVEIDWSAMVEDSGVPLEGSGDDLPEAAAAAKAATSPKGPASDVDVVQLDEEELNPTVELSPASRRRKDTHLAPTKEMDVLPAEVEDAIGHEPVGHGAESSAVDLAGSGPITGSSAGGSSSSFVPLEDAPEAAAMRPGSVADVDLDFVEAARGQKVPVARPPRDEESVLEEVTAAPPITEESSAVDLGSAPMLDLSESGVAKSPSSSGSADLSHLMDEDAMPRSDVRLDEAGLADMPPSDVRLDDQEMVEEEEVPAALAEEEEEKRPVKKPARAKVAGAGAPVTAWVGGGAAGVLVGALLCFALFFAGILPASWVAGKPKETGSRPGPAVQPSQQPDVAAARSVTLPEARALLMDGNFDKVLAGMNDAGPDAEKNDRQALRGEATWLTYLQSRKKAGRIPTTEDPEVQTAKKDLETSNTPEGMFWFGQIQEITNDRAGARKTYEEGLKKFKDKAGLFQGALNRLDSMADEGPAGNKPVEDKSTYLDRAWAAVFIAFQPGEELPAPKGPGKAAAPKGPAANAPKGDTDEAGFKFWEAAKLAKQLQYDKAIDALLEARARHEDRRFLRLRKSQNPQSDPTEEIFLRAADELANYWRLKEKLAKAGYLEARQADPTKAIDKLLADAKDARSGSKGLGPVVQELKKDKDVAKADPDAKDPAKDVDLLIQGKKKAEDQLSNMKSAMEERKIITDDQKDWTKGLDKLVQERKEATDALASTVKVLQAEKYVDVDSPNVGQGLEKLVADKKAAEKQAKDAADKLKAADLRLRDMDRRLANAKGAKGDAEPRSAEAVRKEEKFDEEQVQKLTQAKALTKAGKWTEGIRLYIDGLENLTHAKDQFQDLRSMVDNHPAFRLPDVQNEPRPDLAEKYYASGLYYYWSQNYEQAERDFAEAIKNAGKNYADARYYYFLGLAKLQSDHRDDALAAFAKGAELERGGKPPTNRVNASLERIQGPTRAYLNSYRPAYGR